MRQNRVNSSRFLEKKYIKKNKSINLLHIEKYNYKIYKEFNEVCQFFSDFHKALSTNLLDEELAILLFKDSIAPWFKYINDDMLELDSNYFDEPTRKWYTKKVGGLKKYFIESDN